VLKVVSEVYLRDDLSCGSSRCGVCPPVTAGSSLRPAAAVCAVIDTNVVLHSIDALSSPAFTDLIFLEVVLDEVKHRNVKARH
jgi:hypothetical protein